jgi:hypothetical protein
LQLTPGDSIVSFLAPKGRHTRSNPQLLLVPSEADLEKIIRKGKASQKSFSTAATSASGQLPDSTPDTPVVTSSKISLPFAKLSKKLYFEEFPIEYSSFETDLNLESIDIFPSPDIVRCFSLDSFEYFPTLGFYSPVYVKNFAAKEVETSSPSQTLPSSSKTQPTAVKIETPPSSFHSSPNLHTVKSPSPSFSPRVQNQMAVVSPPANRMDSIVAARYTPLVLPQPVISLPPGDYLKYMPKFMGEEDITTEEHIVAFYNYADNQNIENEDVWMRVIIQSLFGEARKWFRGLAPGSITGIEALDEALLRHWGDKKEFLYYITEFGSLKRKGESVSDFSKIFNKMYNKTPDEIKPTETSSKIIYASAFDLEFFLLPRERRSTSLIHMQYATLEVESSIVASDKLRGKFDRDRRKSRTEASTSDSHTVHPQVEDLTKLVKSLSTEIEKLNMEGKQTYRNTQNTDNKGNFRIPNNAPQIFPRDPRNRERDDQRVQAPLQKNLVADEEEEEVEADPEIHCIGDTSPSPHLTQLSCEKYLMDIQINELRERKRNKILIDII